MKALLRILIAAAACACLLLATTSVASAHGLANDAGGRATCSGGGIAPGVYGSLTITGVCFIQGTVTVQRNLVIAPNAALDAHEGTLVVRGNAHIERNALFVLGCLESGCSSTDDQVNGNVIANGALALIFHHNTIGGNIEMHGGGGGVNCNPNALLQGSPVFSDLEDNQIGGNLAVTQLRSCWLGVIRNAVRGNVLIAQNVMADPDANEIVTNVIGGNLACVHNNPAAQEGDSQGAPNVVAGRKLGECSTL
jgi:hypothetical protein